MLVNHKPISTHAPRTGSDDVMPRNLATIPQISTHAPRTGSDANLQGYNFNRRISTHAPRTGSDCWAYQPPVKPV